MSRGRAGHGPYEEIPSNFGRVWSYRTWGKSIFMFLGNIGNSLHHQIPPNWSSGLQIGPRNVFKARVPSQELSNKLVFLNDPKRKICPGKLDNLPKSSFVDKMAFFFNAFVWAPCLFLGPMGPGTRFVEIARL